MTSHVYVIAGPNEAGKTTFAREFLPNYAHCPNFVNADLIAERLSPLAPETAAIAAGRLMLEKIETFANQSAEHCNCRVCSELSNGVHRSAIKYELHTS